uniref:M48 family metalloprotease n=1 Tax=Desertifilum tharense IPPAS B-1220 TaxID=1781255 RepID=A0ACD5GPS2_9CYAN
MGHVVARHGAQHLAKRQLGAALVNAVGIAASDTPEGGRRAAVIAQAVNQMIQLRYGRDDELESDRLGFRFMTEAQYNPQGKVELMEILGSARQGNEPPEFFSTHPNPGNRIQRLEALIQENYPNGVPPSWKKGETLFAKFSPACLSASLSAECKVLSAEWGKEFRVPSSEWEGSAECKVLLL